MRHCSLEAKHKEIPSLREHSARRLQDDDDALSVSSAAWYEDLVSLVGFAHLERAGEPATQEDLKGVALSGAWLEAFAKTLKGQPALEESGREGAAGALSFQST